MMPDTANTLARPRPTPLPESEPVIVVLRGEPTAAGRPRFTRGGIAYTPVKTRNSLAALRIAGQQVMGDRPPLGGALSLDFRAELKIPSSWSKRKQHQAVLGEILPIVRPDWENLAKIVDGLTAVVWRDDSQIVRATVVKVYSLTPRIVVTITPTSPRGEIIRGLPVAGVK